MNLDTIKTLFAGLVDDADSAGYRPERQVAIEPGQHVWTIFTDHVCEQIVKEVCEGHVRLKGRRSPWLKNDSVFLDRQSASLALAAKFRDRAASFLKAAEELESA